MVPEPQLEVTVKCVGSRAKAALWTTLATLASLAAGPAGDTDVEPWTVA